jgi:hypothetical protein
MRYALCRAAMPLVGAIILGGCGEMASKRGSGPDAFAAARATCRAHNADPSAFQACLSDAGWNVTELGGAPAATPVHTAPPDTRVRSTATAVPVTQFVGASSQPASPSERIAIGSWWKFGAGASDLRAGADACVARLGPADRPDPGFHFVTRALYTCLANDGWHGIRGRAS